MKINWGTGIVIAFIGFISFILYFVIKMSTDSAYAHDLVIEEYYQAELGFQDEIDKESNSNKLTENINWKKSEEGLVIIFPENLDTQKITGIVSLYRTSNKNLDFEMPISISNNQMLIPNNKLLDGRWNLKVDWKYEDNAYLYKKEIMY
ncbi:FixH family protein [Bizionia arctica]|uniref:Cytochrome Cbb3 oxidase maturation protein CcoH n=1 Tax=Bizionia arctica TaxID=1495645 RepID=A0A917GWH3_9FLAO|nr:FixH family protein [Bizionia arctica]GGG58888.1 cytochrome Cbb3 oxidase maturation protein CcoH [Bizionia arctica]